jgi:two-component system, sensor histidine kinase PdtaS
MERLLYFLPEKPQPLWVRYATTTVVMAFCMAVQIGLESKSGFAGLFFLLPGIFAAGLMFDRGTSLYATALGTAFAYFSISPTAPFSGYVIACTLFAGTGAVVGLLEALRTEMEKVVPAEKAKSVLLMELAHRTKKQPGDAIRDDAPSGEAS